MKKAWLNLILPALLCACSEDQGEISCYNAVKTDYTEKITVNGNIRAVKTTFLKSPNMFMCTITWLEENGAFVHKGDTVCIFEHAETTQRLENTRENLKEIDAQLEKIEADHEVKLAMLEADIENNKIQLSINSLDSIQKKFAPPLQKKLLSLQQQKAEIQKEKLDKKYAAQKLIGETEIRGLKSRIKIMENQVERIQMDLNQLYLIAPINGMIMREEAPTMYFMSSNGFGSFGGKMAAGSTTWSNMNILQIPELDSVEVIAELSENQYKKVSEGQKVNIRIDAKNKLQTTGTIKRKMLTGRQMNRGSQVKTYEALVVVDSCHLNMTPGLNATCEIIITEYTDTLVVPAIAVFNIDDEKFVYVKEGRKYRQTKIKTGPSNSTYCIISSDLPAGTEIALSKPPQGKIIREINNLREPVDEAKDSHNQSASEDDSLQIIQ